MGEWILSTTLAAAAPVLPVIADAIKNAAPDTRTGGDPNLSPIEHTILIHGSRRDSGIVAPDTDPTPDSDIGSLNIALPEPTGAETDPGLVAQGPIAERLRALKAEGVIP